MGKVEAILISRKKKTPRIEVDKGNFIRDYGLEGDAYSGKGEDRQVTILSKEGREQINNDRRDGLCFQRFIETVRISGIDMDDLKPGKILRIGKGLFEVTKYRKKCYPECEIIKAGTTCALVSEARFLKVIQSGVVKKGDRVEIILE